MTLAPARLWALGRRAPVLQAPRPLAPAPARRRLPRAPVAPLWRELPRDQALWVRPAVRPLARSDPPGLTPRATRSLCTWTPRPPAQHLSVASSTASTTVRQRPSGC